MAWAQTPPQWASHNRYIEVATGAHQQNYREQDTSGLTANGTLNTETGSQSTAHLAGRWQTDQGWLLHLQATRQSGVTDYNGYLQVGNGTLTPYRATTGNTATQYSLSAGYALNASNWAALPDNWQITPMVQISQHEWQRNLVQYSETYRYTTQAIGALVQWQARPGTVLEAQALWGNTQPASVSVPSLGFAATQPGGSLRQWYLGISQDLGALTGTPALANWRANARYTASLYDHSASPVVNGLQAPPNQHQPSGWLLGLQKQF